jgi:hypothetical protein
MPYAWKKNGPIDRPLLEGLGMYARAEMAVGRESGVQA